MRMIKPYISLLLVLIVLTTGVYIYSNHREQIQDVFTKKQAQLDSFSLENETFVVTGNGLSRVEIWAIPTGTAMTEDDYLHIGDATRAAKNEFGEVWQMPVPANPLLVTTLFAKGFDTEGNEIGRIDWSVVGATDIYDALWSSIQGNAKELKLKPGSHDTFHDLTVTLTSINADSRCPVDVQCIRAGDIEVSLLAETNTNKKMLKLKDTDAPLEFDGYTLQIVGVDPVKKQGVTPQNTTYTVHVMVSILQ